MQANAARGLVVRMEPSGRREAPPRGAIRGGASQTGDRSRITLPPSLFELRQKLHPGYESSLYFERRFTSRTAPRAALVVSAA